jgi:transposase InsO family protein
MKIATWPQVAPRGAVSEFCAQHQISRSQFYEIRARARREGPLAVLAARPRAGGGGTSIAAEVEDWAVRIRKELAEQGLDHGPITVRHEMLAAGLPAPSRATLARVFTRRGMVLAQPAKRPRSSWRRFTFAAVHECWQLDATEWALAGGGTGTVFQLIDDHSRFIVASGADHEETSRCAVQVMKAAVAAHQAPVLLLTDNGVAMNPHRRGATSQLVTYATTLGTRAITSRIYHPQTCGKNERLHSTLKRWLRARPLPATIEELAALVAQFDDRYNQRRPHQALDMNVPAHILLTGPRATPPQPPPPPPAPGPARGRSSTPTLPTPARPPDQRVTRVRPNGTVKIIGGYHIGLGVEHAGSDVLCHVQANLVTIYDAHGTQLRRLRVHPDQRYYGTGRPRNRGSQPARQRLNARINPTQLSGPS